MLRRTLLALCLLAPGLALAQDAYPDAAFRQAEELIEQGDLSAARRALEKGLKRVPDHANGWVNHGNLLLLEQDFAGASSSFQQALSIDAQHYVALNGMGAALMGQQQFEAAIEYFLRSVEAKPEYITPLVNLGDISLLRNQPALAIKYYALALEVDPMARKPTLALAELHVVGALYEHALKYLDPLLASNPGDVDALELQGRALLGQGLPLRALDPLLQAQELDPARVDTQRLVGMSCLQTAQFGCAEDAYRAALTTQPGDAELHLELGQVYRTAGEETWDRAHWHFLKSAELDPTVAAPLFEAASLEEDLDRTLDALEHYDRALQLEPHHCPSLSNLARLYKLGGKPAEAEVLLDRCLASDPGFVLALINRGWVRIDAGMCDEARQDLEPLTDRQDAWGEQARVLLEQCP